MNSVIVASPKNGKLTPPAAGMGMPRPSGPSAQLGSHLGSGLAFCLTGADYPANSGH